VTILPIHFASAKTAADLRRASESPTVRTLFRTNSIPVEELLPAGGSPSYVEHNDFEWVAPTLFFSAALISQNPDFVSLALSVLGNYITDFFKGRPGQKTTKLSIVIEKAGDWSCKTVNYDGDASGISEIAHVIRELYDD
jgi:hypothetical protein